MKKVFLLLILPLFAACDGEAAVDQTNEEDTSDTLINEHLVDEIEQKKEERLSPRVLHAYDAGGLKVHFDYGSPRVRDRVIWGELVPYNEVWRAGADEVSAVTFEQDVFVGEKAVDAGTYGMFIIPKKSGAWTFILNEEWSQKMHGVWGAFDYKQEKDVLRLDIEPQWEGNSLEELTYYFEPGQIVFKWEKAVLYIPVKPVD